MHPTQIEEMREKLQHVRALNAQLLEVLHRIDVQLECPSRNTTMTSYRKDGSVIISQDLREAVRAAIAKAATK